MHLDLISLVKTIGYIGVAATIFLESGTFLGIVLPGSSLLFTAGLLSSQGYFNPWILIPLVTFAAVAGDSVGYWFGKRVGLSLFSRKDSLLFKHEHLEYAKKFYDRRGPQTVFLARFVPIVRMFAPMIAGIVEMPYRLFITWNIAGALAWACGVTAAGYFLGERFAFIDNYLSQFVLLIIVVSILPLLKDVIVLLKEQWKNS